VAAQIAGSVGTRGSANIGEHVSMFEAIHGSAPRRAGKIWQTLQDYCLGAVMMLVHIGETDAAANVHNAWLRTIEDGVTPTTFSKRARANRRWARKNLLKLWPNASASFPRH